MFEKEAEEYKDGKGHEHYNFLFEENAGSPADFAKLCFQDGAEYGYNKAKAELEERVKQQSDRITELTQELDDSINRFG